MRLRKCGVDVNAQRRLLALIATQQPPAAVAANSASTATAASATSDERFDAVLVYLHGFPDMAVHPTKLDFASRMPFKLAETWLSSTSNTSAGTSSSVAFVAFNFGGVPGSDRELRFTDKTISQEVDDAVAVCEFVRKTLLRVRVNAEGNSSGGKVHVVGLSTGAIIASLLRSRAGVADSIAVIAGLLDLERGIEYDFSPQQMAQFESEGACWKEFYLPEGVPQPENVEISFDGETSAEILKRYGGGEAIDDTQDESLAPRRVFIRLSKKYVDGCRDGTLDIEQAVSSGVWTTTRPLPPFLVIHGDADQNVPFHNGEELFSAASEPKTFLPIAKANHLLSNSKHLKKALKAIVEHTRTAPAQLA
ncbi:hypothetical protein Gpo141_00014688 [Globisporangium polare]